MAGKMVSGTAAALLLATSATAGGLAPVVVPAPEVIIEEPAGSSGAGLIIPLILVALILVAMQDDGEESQPSDARMKTDITPTGRTAAGLPLYQYRYLGQSTLYEGVMAQDVLALRPEAIVPLPFGLMAVNYAMLGITMKTIH